MATPRLRLRRLMPPSTALGCLERPGAHAGGPPPFRPSPRPVAARSARPWSAAPAPARARGGWRRAMGGAQPTARVGGPGRAVGGLNPDRGRVGGRVALRPREKTVHGPPRRDGGRPVPPRGSVPDPPPDPVDELPLRPPR